MLFDGSSPDGDFTFLGTYKKLGEKTALFVHFVCTNDHFTKTGLVKTWENQKKYRFLQASIRFLPLVRDHQLPDKTINCLLSFSPDKTINLRRRCRSRPESRRHDRQPVGVLRQPLRCANVEGSQVRA